MFLLGVVDMSEVLRELTLGVHFDLDSCFVSFRRVSFRSFINSHRVLVVIGLKSLQRKVVSEFEFPRIIHPDDLEHHGSDSQVF